MPTKTQSLRDTLAAGTRAARGRLGLRQDEAAMRLRAHGLTSWLRGTVAQAETGGRRFSLEDLLLLAVAYETTLADLLAGEDGDWIELSSEARLTVGALRALLSGERVSIHTNDPHVDVPANRSSEPLGSEAAEEGRRFGVRRPADVTQAVAGVGDPERRVARKLGTTPERVNLAAWACWGRTLTQERDHRVSQRGETSPQGLQALRGHITRDLTTELETELRRRGII